jgi:FAD/FMN-containing dehydrogenase
VLMVLLGDVGVGGYLLGGGLSFLSSQYGMACDTVVEYEVVLANATVVIANANTNTDLYWALKGGGNQFGIILNDFFEKSANIL